MKEKIRVSVDLSPEEKADFDEVQKEIGSSTLVGMLRKGIKILKFITEAEKEGGKLFMEMPNGERRQIIIL